MTATVEWAVGISATGAGVCWQLAQHDNNTKITVSTPFIIGVQDFSSKFFLFYWLVVLYQLID